MTLTWKPPVYEGGRLVGMCGQIEVGAVFQPLGTAKRWGWRMLIGEIWPQQGEAKTEQAAKDAVGVCFQKLLGLAGLRARPEMTDDNLIARTKACSAAMRASHPLCADILDECSKALAGEDKPNG